jgi:hypothetical protein
VRPPRLVAALVVGTADLATGVVVLAAVPVAAVGHRVREVSRPAVTLVRDDVARQVSAALDRLVPAAVDQVMRRIDVNELVDKHIDVEGLIAGMDLATLANQVLAQIDLPEIIRQSTGSVASETLRGVRMQAISADDVVARLGGRLRLRRPPQAVPLSLPAPADEGIP